MASRLYIIQLVCVPFVQDLPNFHSMLTQKDGQDFLDILYQPVFQSVEFRLRLKLQPEPDLVPYFDLNHQNLHVYVGIRILVRTEQLLQEIIVHLSFIIVY